ncbi:MAG TPA: hypothetical protein VJT50_00825 [Pyrinomonadaceae bacterium]|nr:hypothetical protein [Pyrinomonadaceae bacterium]
MYKTLAGILVSVAVSFVITIPRPITRAQNTPPTTADSGIPQYVVYRVLFHEAYLRKREALKAEVAGNARFSAGWRSKFRRYAQLTESEATLLEQLADACEADVAAQDARAREIVRRDKARYPGGEVNGAQNLQAPSPELSQMQTERNAIILKYRDALRYGLGEVTFARFQKLCKGHGRAKHQTHPFGTRRR